MSPAEVAELEEAAQEWDRIAAEKAAWGDYEASRGNHAPAAYNLARACKETADALRLQIRTGVWTARS